MGKTTKNEDSSFNGLRMPEGLRLERKPQLIQRNQALPSKGPTWLVCGEVYGVGGTFTEIHTGATDLGSSSLQTKLS